MNDFPSSYGDDVKWHLSLRCEQPIEGCEVAPHPYLKIKSAALDNPTKARLQDNHPHTYTFRWFRGPKRNPCANDECSRNHDFSPVRWSRPAIHGHSVLCAVCERAGVPRYLISFCSLE
jgi:CCR4-NOT transcription complex subunit 6